MLDIWNQITSLEKPLVIETTKVKGVYRKGNKWWARIHHNKKQHILGQYVDIFEAICARKSAENKRRQKCLTQ